MLKINQIEYKQSLSELDFILKYTDSKLVKKISQKFLDYIRDEKDKEYTVNLDINIPVVEEQEINERTKNLMGIIIIYRGYFSSVQERREYD